ncbi:YdeI family protein [Dyadobacter subterraneus]|uniref:YdeI/OmpD-associated family protein n=2 Tax=Dyadobacter subterraneus TaxID=2773304 RepID=A0ABR9WHZ5_9BACT|nr:YdeI/OmpD-associated family protein [Dyadobacter subterraneus]MBE9464724.1 YdeI/OmpD-associated family protein [Dyadobacter subterraneus]
MSEKDLKTFCPESRHQWRRWLEENHDRERSVWVIFYKNKSNLPTITWSEAVDEALCFGWIDSIAKPIDEEKFMRFFSKRKAKSVWSAINKEKIKRLIDEKLITKAGFECIEIAKQNGTWTILDHVEALVIPEDLEKELQKRPSAKSYFSSLSKSDKKGILQWLVQAKRSETREKRIIEIAELAEQNLKPKVIQWTKKPLDE